MIRYMCDKCGIIISQSNRKHLRYYEEYSSTASGHTNSADLCKTCYDKVLNYIHSKE